MRPRLRTLRPSPAPLRQQPFRCSVWPPPQPWSPCPPQPLRVLLRLPPRRRLLSRLPLLLRLACW
jgi:hypothetical protein